MAARTRRDFDDLPDGRRVFYAVRNYSRTDTRFQARWESQMEQRRYITEKAVEMGIGDDDVFIYSDVDELMSREAVDALTRCDPIPTIAGDLHKCAKRSVKTYGLTYNFNRSSLNTAQAGLAFGFHPDYTLGRCLKDKNGLWGWSAHDIRENELVEMREKRAIELSWAKLYGPKFRKTEQKTQAELAEEKKIMAAINLSDKKVDPKTQWLADSKDLEGWEKALWIGTPAGWHMYSFTRTKDLVDEQSMRAGAHSDETRSEWYGCNAADIEAVIALDKEGEGDISSAIGLGKYFKLPHAIEEFPEKFPFFLKTVPDSEWPTFDNPRRPLPILDGPPTNA